MTETVRETRRADELKVGDWLREDENGALKPNEVKAVFQYPAAVGIRVHLTTQAPGRKPFSAFALDPDALFELASDAEVGAQRGQAERAQKIADIRALADWLEANPEVPLAAFPGEQVHLHGDDAVAQVRAFAAKFGVEVRDHLDDRTQATAKIGSFEYELIAWHRDGRPADPGIAEHYETSGWKGEGPGTCGIECACGVTYDGFDSLAEAHQQLAWHIADPSGQDYGRADSDADDPTPVSPARVPMHTGGMTEGGLVDETPEIRPLDTERLGVPGMVTCSYCLNRVMDVDWLAHARTHDPLYGALVDETPELRLCWHSDDCPGSGPDCGPA